MLLSELIETAQGLLESEGDHDVMINDPEDSDQLPLGGIVSIIAANDQTEYFSLHDENSYDEINDDEESEE